MADELLEVVLRLVYNAQAEVFVDEAAGRQLLVGWFDGHDMVGSQLRRHFIGYFVVQLQHVHQQHRAISMYVIEYVVGCRARVAMINLFFGCELLAYPAVDIPQLPLAVGEEQAALLQHHRQEYHFAEPWVLLREGLHQRVVAAEERVVALGGWLGGQFVVVGLGVLAKQGSLLTQLHTQSKSLFISVAVRTAEAAVALEVLGVVVVLVFDHVVQHR